MVCFSWIFKWVRSGLSQCDTNIYCYSSFISTTTGMLLIQLQHKFPLLVTFTSSLASVTPHLCGKESPGCDTSHTYGKVVIELLYQLVDAIQNTVSNKDQQVSLKAMFLTAFHGFLRVGEITSSPNCISIANVDISNNTVTISLPSYKHSNGT